MDKEDEASYFLPKCRIVKTLKLSVRIDSLGETDRFGETVRVGKFDWCLTARRVYTKHLCKKSYLGVYLHCKSPLQPHEYANVSLHFVLNSFQYSSLHYWRNVWAQFDEHANTWGNDRFLSWDRLLNRSPFVKHGRICVEVDMKIKRENDLTKTPIRDDDGDMRLIFEDERKKWMIPYCKQRQNKKIAMEIEMANFTKTGVFTKEFKISGVPFSFRLLKNPTQNCLDLEFYCNWMDPSPWWRCEVFGEFKISNQKSKKYKKGEHFFAHSMFPRIFQKTDFCWNLFGFIDWDLLTNETYRCVKDGIFMLEVYVDLREKYGFDVADYDVNVGSVSLDFIEQFINDNATLQNVYTFAPIPLKVLNLNQDNGYSKLSELLSHLKSLNKNSINVMLIVNGSHVFLANKRILANSFDYFFKIFEKPQSSKFPSHTVTIDQDLNPEEFFQFLQCVYKKRADVTEENYRFFLDLAFRFSAPKILIMCSNFIQYRDVKLDHADKILLADKYHLEHLFCFLVNTLPDETRNFFGNRKKFRKLTKNSRKRIAHLLRMIKLISSMMSLRWDYTPLYN